MKIKVIILIVFLFSTHIFCQNSLDLIYVADKQPQRNQIQSKVEEVLSKTTLNDLAIYVSYRNQEVLKIRKNQDISSLISQSVSHEASYNQLIKLNHFFSENEYFEDLESINPKDILKEKLHLHFFFNLEDFFVYNEFETILESILNINRLLSYQDGQKKLNKNCVVSIYLRGGEFLKSKEFLNNYQKHYNHLLNNSNYKLYNY